jgi:hypothetical protein
MELQLRMSKTTTIAERTVKCVFCRDPIPLTDALKSRGVCALCQVEIAELGWRIVYDRDLNIGEIPANLRTAYNL